MNQDILTLADAALYLKVSEKTIRRLIDDEAIPCAKVGGQWRFMKTMIDDWLRSQMKVVPHQEFMKALQAQKDAVSLSALIDPSCVFLSLETNDAKEVLGTLSRSLQECRAVSDASQFLHQLIAREQLMSTGVGRGTALPHPREAGKPPVLRNAIAVGYSSKGVQFKSLDGKRTHLFFVIASTNESVHLKIQSMLVRIAGEEDFMNRISSLESPSEFIRYMIEKENEILGR